MPLEHHQVKDQRLTLAEQAAVDLTLAILKIETVERAVQVSSFAVGDARNAQSAGDLLDRGKHIFASSSLNFIHNAKIGAEAADYQLSLRHAAMRKMHNLPLREAKMVKKRS